MEYFHGQHQIYGPIRVAKSEWNTGKLFVWCELLRKNGPTASPERLALGRCAIKLN